MELRKNPRFSLMKPVELRIHHEWGWRAARGIVQNASLGGAFLLTDCAVEIGSEVEVTIVLSAAIRLCSSGKVIRVAKTSRENENGVAVECAQPWVQTGFRSVN